MLMRISAADAVEIAAIRKLLAESGLPGDDLMEPLHTRFLAAHTADGMLAGIVGLESFGRHGLLRSLAVHAEARRQGLGAELTRRLERYARDLGVETLYLLTTTAEGFFTARGYQRYERRRVPPEIAATSEFRLLCPANAVCMYKQAVTMETEETSHDQP
ncbi:MAG: GNAT family N-acetyltransferase [Gammaproteobacteria bacterium]|nr:GNAT family N-acetyltransferase [Gammaproteobacteria bacterium]MDE2345887.1 GNAT family N-acetyltransferase [Gammaproteobacteria bacterium]